MQSNVSKVCIACGSNETNNLGKPIYSDANSKYSVIECKVCKLQWSDPMPTIEEMDKHYTKYYEIRYNTVDKYPLKNKIRNFITFRKLRLNSFFRIIEKYSPEKSILDFGCGEADILYEAKKEDWKILGVDYSNELSEKFKEDGIDFIQSNDLNSTGIGSHTFGCISAKHTVEHLTDLEEFFKSVKKYLTNNGILAVKTPSSTSLRARSGLADWHYVRPPEHCWGFNVNNFGKLLEKNGFEIIYLKDSLLVDELICIARVKNNI